MSEKVFFDIRPQLNKNLVGQILRQLFPDFGEDFDWQLLQGGWENANLIINKEGEKFILRIYRFGKRKQSDIEKELTVTNFFYQKGLPTTKIILLNGSLFKKINILGKNHIVAVFSFLNGKNLAPEEVDETRIKQIAGLLSKIHLSGKDYPPEHLPQATNLFLSRAEELKNLFTKSSPDRQLSEFLRIVLDKFKIILTSQQDNTVLHNDYSRGNIFFNHGEIAGVLDWQEAIYGPAIWDIGKSISYFVVDGNLTLETVLKNYLNGYFNYLPDNQQDYLIATAYFCYDMAGKVIETYPKNELKTDKRFLKIIKFIKEICVIF